MPRKFTITLATLIVAIAVVAGGLLWVGRNSTNAADTSEVASQTTEDTRSTAYVQSDYVSYQGVAGQSALAQLKQVVPEVVTKSSEYGEYVEAMNGLAGGTDDYYWSFYVDGTMSSVGADSYISAGGELIEWKYQSL